MSTHNLHLFKHRQGQKGKIVIVAGPTCDNCGEPATLSKTVDGKVKRTCSIHWNTPKQQEKQATTDLLKSLGLILSS